MKIWKNKPLLTDILVFIILPFIMTLIIESMGMEKLFGGFIKLFTDPFIFLCNVLIIASTLSVGLVLKRFRYFWVSIVASLWFIVGIANFILVSTRVLPLTPYDIQLADALPIMMKKYLSPGIMAVICIFLVLLMIALFTIFFRTLAMPKKKESLKRPLIFFTSIISLTLASVNIGIGCGILETEFKDLPNCFIKNGFVYSFTASFVGSGVTVVAGYDNTLMGEITASFKESAPKNVKKPNIIFVQMESFFDLNSLNNIKFSQNPVPNLTKLKSEHTSGLFTVPIIGAGTVNTEFEVITGMRNSDFGPGEYPYKTILLETTCESIAYNLKKHGYTSHFIHNYLGAFYGRNKVYSNLGYDYFFSIEYMTGYTVNVNGWAEDEILVRYINESLDSSEGPDLINAVTVQGHGSYEIESGYTKHLTVTECENEDMRSSYEYYANQIHEMDMFLGSLIDSMSARDEDTIIVIYGDHFPSIGFEDDDLEGRNTYQTDYVIWNNMGINYENEDLCSYQINSKVLEKLNITNGVINACHQTYKNSEDYEYYLQALEYDMLYGDKHVFGGENPYPPSTMKINRRKMVISDVMKSESIPDTYTVLGDSFTKRCYVRVGFTLVPTTYIDEHTLQFKSQSVKDGASVTVWEKDIGNSNKYIYK